MSEKARARNALPVTLPIIDCCSVPDNAPIDRDDAERLASAFEILADASRLQLLSFVADSGEACICDLQAATELSQPTVSHHMKILTDAGLVDREKRGKWAYYRPVREPLTKLAQAIRSLR